VLLRGHRLRRPAEDTRQLGAEAIMIDGVVRLLWRPRTSKDRLAAGEVIAAARTWLPRHRTMRESARPGASPVPRRPHRAALDSGRGMRAGVPAEDLPRTTTSREVAAAVPAGDARLQPGWSGPAPEAAGYQAAAV